MQLRPLNDLPLLEKAAALADEAGVELYAVGGCARDWALGRPSEDIDFLVGGDQAPLVAGLELVYGGTHRKFTPFLTVRFFSAAGRRLDFVRFRKETYAHPGALPTVSEAASAAEDLRRRDFACNAMALRLNGPERYSLLDPFNGLADLRDGLLRVLHEKSFEDDPTRVYRAARFAGRFGWRLEAGTLALARAAVASGLPGALSRERLRNELVKLLSEENPLPALELLRDLGALAVIHPAFAFGPSVAAQAGAKARIAAVAALMGAAGEEFLAGLKFSRKETEELRVLSESLRRA